MKTNYSKAALAAALAGSLCAAIEGQGQATKTLEVKPNVAIKKEWNARWQKQTIDFTKAQGLLSTFASGSLSAVTAVSVDIPILAKQRRIIWVQVPVAASKIVKIQGWARERMPFPDYPWHECPFEYGKECGQVNGGEIAPGGIAFLPYSVKDNGDGTTLIGADCMNWSGTLIRLARISVDYVP
jgi:hypothetical protein